MQPGLSDERAIGDAKAQKADFEQKLDGARVRKYKIEAFLAQLESKPAPAAPQLFNEAPLSESMPSAKTMMSGVSVDSIKVNDGFAGKTARALYSYAGNAEQEELDLKEGEDVTIVSREGHWLKVKNERAQTGFIPENYVEIVD